MIEHQFLLFTIILAVLAGCHVDGIGSESGVECKSPSGEVDSNCVLSTLDSEERLEQVFGAGAVDFRVLHSFIVSRHPSLDRDVALCTQGSVDRLSRLKEQAESWHGSLSAAIYVRPHEVEGQAWIVTLERINALHKYIEGLERCRLTLSLVFGMDPAVAREEFDTL